MLKLSIYTSFDDLAIYKSNSFRLLLSTDFSGPHEKLNFRLHTICNLTGFCIFAKSNFLMFVDIHRLEHPKSTSFRTGCLMQKKWSKNGV